MLRKQATIGELLTSTRPTRLSYEEIGRAGIRNAIGRKLREARRRMGMRGVEVAAMVHMHHTRLSRIELGQVAVRQDEAKLLLDILKINKAERDEIEFLISELDRGPWWNVVRRLSSESLTINHDSFWCNTRNSERIKWFELSIVPTYLQALSYIDQQYRVSLIPSLVDSEPMEFSDGERREMIEYRLGVQADLFDPERHFEFILCETTFLLRHVSENEMVAQCHRIVQLSMLPNVSIRIIPSSRVFEHQPQTSFTIFDGETVRIDTTIGPIMSDAKRAVFLYLAMFDEYREIALGEEDSRDFIGEIALKMASDKSRLNKTN